ncbi:hypothetical protein D1872_274100 [compost metagenome]
MGIAAMQADDQVRLEITDQPGNGGFEALHPGGVFRIRLERNVHAGSVAQMFTPFLEKSRPGEQVFSRFMNGICTHIRVGIEAPLYPVSVVNVGVDVQHPGPEPAFRVSDGHGGVVIDAEACGFRR